MWIFLLIILVIGAALNGDTSGLQAIGKILLYVGLFLGIAWTIVNVPWLLVLVAVVVIVWGIASSSNNNSTNNTISNHNNYTNTKVNTIIEPIENPTSFQSKLQQNSKTPEQVKNEQQSKEVEQARRSANIDYEAIKRELLQQAKSGNYTTINGHKTITFDHKYRWKPSFIGERSGHTYINKTIFNPSGQYASKISIFITDRIYYDAYIAEIKRLLSNDGITVQAGLFHKNNGTIYSLPHHSIGFGESVHHYEFVLRCSVQY